MSLTLAIDTSSINYGVAVFTPDAVRAHRTVRRDDAAFAGIGHLAQETLDEAAFGFGDVRRLAVNSGPGNLGSIRAGVAYVNGLAFSLGRPIFAGNALELLAMEAGLAEGQPVLALRNAGSGNVYAGLFAPDVAGRFAHGPLATVVRSLAAQADRLTVAGSFRVEAVAALEDRAVSDSGVEFTDALALWRLMVVRGDEALVEVATPLNDASAVFA